MIRRGLSCDKLAFYHLRFKTLLTVAYRFSCALVLRTETGVLLPPSSPKVPGMIASSIGEKTLKFTASQDRPFVGSRLVPVRYLCRVPPGVNVRNPLRRTDQSAPCLLHSMRVSVGIA